MIPFYMYKPPEGNKYAEAYKSFRGTMKETQENAEARKKAAEELIQSKQKTKREELEQPLDLRVKTSAAEKAEKSLPLEIDKLRKEIEKEASQSTLNQHLSGQADAHVKLMGAQEQAAFLEGIKTKAETNKINFINDILAGANGSNNAPNNGPPVSNIPNQNRSSNEPLNGPNNITQSQILQQQPGTTAGIPPSGTMPQYQEMPSASQGVNAIVQAKMNSMTPQQRALMKVADIEAALQGKPQPSMQFANEAAIEQIKEQVKEDHIYNTTLRAEQSKDMNTYLSTLTDQAKNAQQSNLELDQILNAANKAQFKGAWVKYVKGFASFDPAYREAQKSEAQLQISSLGQMKGQGRMDMLIAQRAFAGIPSIEMPEEALRRVAKFVKGTNLAVIEKANLTEKYSELIPNKAKLALAIENIANQNKYIDPKGNVHLHAIKDWEKIATPQRMLAEANLTIDHETGKIVPKFYSDEELNLIRGKSVSEAIPTPERWTEKDILGNMKELKLTRRQAIDLMEKENKKK